MKQLICFLLILSTLAALLVGCKGDGTGDVTTQGGSVATVAPEATDEYGRPLVSNPVIESGDRFEDTEIRILYVNQQEAYDSDLVGEKINDANFVRDINTETALGVIMLWEQTEWGSQAGTYNNLVTQSTMGGVPYNILLTHDYYSANMAVQGYYQNVAGLPYLDFAQPWWTTKMMDELVINGVSYFASGDMTISRMAATTALFFNKNLYTAKYPDGGIYDMVFENRWYMETFMEMVKEVYVDKDGVAGTSEHDILGLVTSPSSQQGDAFFYGFGVRLTKENAQGKMEIALGDDRSVAAFSKTYELFQEAEGAFYRKDAPTTYDWAYPRFVSGEVLFISDRFGSAQKFKDMAPPYGVLPVPMLDETQGEYYTSGVGGLIAIPVNAPEINATAATLDLLNYYGYRNLAPTYFENMLQTEYSNAPEDARVYEILRDAQWADFGIIYSFAMDDPLWSWRKQLREASNGISTYWASNKELYQRGLDDIVDAFRLLPVA